MFFKFDENMRKIFNQDIDKHNILTWIIYNTNYQEECNGLKKYQCYVSIRAISEDTNINHAKTHRLLKKLIDDGFISYVKKSKSKHTSSIIYANFLAENNIGRSL